MIGGGAMGASVAWHLRELGVSDVVLLERESLASGSTSRSAGGIRTQFADELNVRIALRSLEEFRRLADEIDLKEFGYLFLLDSRRGPRALPRGDRAPKPSGRPLAGADGRRGGGDRPAARNRRPRRSCLVRLGRLLHARGARAGLRARGRRAPGMRRGADRRPGRPRRGGGDEPRPRSRPGRSSAARGRGRPRSPGRRASRSPCTASRAICGSRRRTAACPRGCRSRSTSRRASTSTAKGPGSLSAAARPSLEELAPLAARRLPLLADLPIQSSWWGYYEVSPDHNAIVGETAEPIALPLRDRLLRTRLPAGAGGGRAPRRARRRPQHLPSTSSAVRPRALRAGRGEARDVRRLVIQSGHVPPAPSRAPKTGVRPRFSEQEPTAVGTWPTGTVVGR